MEFIDLKTQQSVLNEAIGGRIAAVLSHGQYIMGPEVRQLEERLEDYVGGGRCITVASGTEALLIALMALDIQPGDEIVTTPFTLAATAEVIALLGAVPVFIDIESDTANIDVRLIEDAAQSFCATFKGRRSCDLSHVGCTSFFLSKPLGCYGDGGAIFTRDEKLARIMREIRTHGQERRYFHTRLGVGGRMDTLQCAVVLAKLERFDWEVTQRLKLGARYDALLKGHVETVAVRPDRTSVYAQYSIFVDNREKLRDTLQDVGVPTAVHYPIPLNQQPAYAKQCSVIAADRAEAASKRVMSLPMSADLSLTDQDFVVESLRNSL
tara:strand:- start:742 stop:1713 length:972 start_codon:yes stop_codon:yes gene_type:complete